MTSNFQTNNGNQQLKLFNSKYQMVRRVSQGTFGMVYEGLNKANNEVIAIKIEKQKDGQTLDREVHFMTRLQGLQGIPKLYWSGLQDGMNVMVVQMLGNDLSQIVKRYRKLSLKSVIQIGIQLVLMIEKVHARSIIHRDLKPENIVIGKDKEADKIYLIDFGISKFYRDNNNKHIDFQEKKNFVGTTRYASISSHQGHELGRKDDLEQIMYVLIYLSKGSLPWQNLLSVNIKDRTKAVGDAKMKLSIQDLCKDLPEEFGLALDYVKKLSFKNDPNYSQILTWFQNAAKKNNINLDYIYEWCEAPIITQISSEIKPNQPKGQGRIGQRSQSINFIQVNGNQQQQSRLNPPEVIKKQDSKGSFNTLQNKYTPSMNIVNEQNEEWNISKDILKTPPQLIDLSQEEINVKSNSFKNNREPETNENLIALLDFDVKGSFQSSEFKNDISLWLRLKFLDHQSDLRLQINIIFFISKGLITNKFQNKQKINLHFN